ncbi:SDR family NAD(P)-dependent oxidoreductase [Thermoleophilia bacterium SCSIO 60948]|nr:SDR family NAD(P)-dependent oxidoreductase [Thermoleophilia bacterium SCSIO 60948]
MELGGQTRAIVTGASAGIGRAICDELAGRGVRLGVVARGAERLEALAAELPPSPAGPHVALPADVSDAVAISGAIEDFVTEAGGLDLFVANAGLAHYREFASQPVAEIEEMIRVNVTGTALSVHAALGPMLDAGRGHVVVLSSGAGLRAFPQAAVYGATKHFDKGLAEALRHELDGTGVSVTTVYPGEFTSELHEHERERLPDWRSNDEERDPAELASAIAAAVEADRAGVYLPREVRLLGLNGIAPRVVDRILVRLRGRSAAPRRG